MDETIVTFGGITIIGLLVRIFCERNFQLAGNFLSPPVIQAYGCVKKIPASDSGVSRISKVRIKQIPGAANRQLCRDCAGSVFQKPLSIAWNGDCRDSIVGFARRVRPGLNAAQKQRCDANKKAARRQFTESVRLLHEFYRMDSKPIKGESKNEVQIDSCSCVWSVFHDDLKRAGGRTQHPGSQRASHRIFHQRLEQQRAESAHDQLRGRPRKLSLSF